MLNDKHQEYIRLLKAYNEHTNIYSKNAYSQLETHIEDCITLASLIDDSCRTIVDFGSGSGLPAIILAIEKKETPIYAIESKSRKTRFLEQAKQALQLKHLHVINENINEFIHHNNIKADVITAKAFGSPEKIMSFAKKIKHSRPSIFIPISEAQSKQYQYDNGDIIQKNNFYYLKLKL